jgi:WD40 repeat protein
MDFSLEYLSCGCNKNPGCVCWGYNGIVVFGSSSNILVYSTKLKKVVQSLSGHKGRVNCLEWVKDESRGMARVEQSELLVSASADNTAFVWRISHR